MVANDNLNLSSASDLIFGGITSLAEITSPTDSGAYLIGVNDEFTYSTSTNVQAVLNDLDQQLTIVGPNYWQLNGNAISPANSTHDVLFGGTSTTSSRFAFINNTGRATPVASISANNGSNATLPYGRRNTGYY